MIRFSVLASLSLSSLLLGLHLSAAEKSGNFQMGEGNELIVQNGIILREVPAPENGQLPMIAVGQANGHHFLFDPNKMTLEGTWSGQFGRVDQAGNFVPSNEKMKGFSLDRAPWTFGEKPRYEAKSTFIGADVREGKVVFSYKLEVPEADMSWDIEESPEFVTEQLQRIHFKINPSRQNDEYLNYWLHQTDFRRVTTDGQQNQRNLLKNLLPNQRSFTISFLRNKDTPTIPNGYSVDTIEIPSIVEPFRFEPTDFDFAEDGTLYVSTRTGGIWARKDGKWKLFADGLDEVNGIRSAPDGSGVYVMQKPELTLLKDTDGNGVADVYQTVEDRFRFTGQYHEFAYGPRINSAGEMFFSLGLNAGGAFSVAPDGYPNQMTSPLGYRGWVMKHSPDGSVTPFASGLRSPAGIGMNSKDELFVTDNQGDWIASSYLSHVEEGDFLGHPASYWDMPEYGLTPRVMDFRSVNEKIESVPPLDLDKFAKIRKRPAVFLAHGDLTNSPGHPSFAPKTGFGPFADQAFIADIAHRNITRVALEKVAGAYQGAAFPFIRPLGSAAYSTAFDPEGNLWVGSVGRGWVAGDPLIEVIRFDETQTPFEMHHISLTKDGFDIHFTEALSEELPKVEDISINHYQFEYWDEYGSEPINESLVGITGLQVSKDRKVLSVKLPLEKEFIYQIQLPELESKSGQTLENNYAYYTLNRLQP
ncbi:hypothetical protein ACFSSA_05700 [Luteolibacter algae]|uniref:DUF7133 domain-containing protein n=1 Tax=Luteolibacter algae TaxID=454151 RepID=A0ABW5D610_9BACT